MSTPLPTLAEELATRAAYVAQLRAFFKRYTYTELEADQLKRIVGDNYQQRVSDCRYLCDVPDCQFYGLDTRDHGGCVHHGMHILNVPRSETRADGSRRRLSGAYLYRPQAPIGRSADQSVAQQTLWGY